MRYSTFLHYNVMKMLFVIYYVELCTYLIRNISNNVKTQRYL